MKLEFRNLFESSFKSFRFANLSWVCHEVFCLLAMDPPHQLLRMLLGFEKSMALSCICKLGIPDILHRAGPNSFLSVQEIARHLPGDHVNTTFLAQILKASAAFGILAGKPDGATGTTCYGLNALSSLLTVDENPSSLAPMVLMHMHPVAQAPWYHLADSVLTGANPFTIAHGKVNSWSWSSSKL